MQVEGVPACREHGQHGGGGKEHDYSAQEVQDKVSGESGKNILALPSLLKQCD